MSDLSDNAHAVEAVWRRLAANEISLVEASELMADLAHSKGLMLDPNDVPDAVDPDPGPDPEPEPGPVVRLDGVYDAGTTSTLRPWPGKREVKDFHGSGQTPSDRVGKTNTWPWPKQQEPRTTTTMQRAANGAFDGYVESFAKAVAGKTDREVWHGLAHEGNTASKSTQPWAFLSNPSVEVPLFKKMWVRDYKIIKGVDPKFVVCVCFGLWDVTLANLRLWTPAEADGLMMDVYDRGTAERDPVARWNKRHKPGLDAVEAFLRERRAGGKRFRYGIGEFGAADGTMGGGDNAYFMARFFEHCDRADAEIMCYHHSDKSTNAAANHDLNDFPKMLAEYNRRTA
jgi:hypothetical protein